MSVPDDMFIQTNMKNLSFEKLIFFRQCKKSFFENLFFLVIIRYYFCLEIIFRESTKNIFFEREKKFFFQISVKIICVETFFTGLVKLISS